MLRAAWWTYAALALYAAGAGARVYERCELARDLRGLGVGFDHVSTWVCIAFHESRFDTAARNPHSGDHGLLQISQLYWCGGGKACGLPCEALRDDDISDDVKCALRVYEEHTRLQGDGFLAWVVYPQHCKHNTKKYLADCDDTLKNASTKPVEKSRAIDTPTRTSFKLRLNQSIDELLPPYFSSLSTQLNSGHSRNKIEVYDKSYQRKWQVTQFSNIDDLSLPVFGPTTNKITESPTTPLFISREVNQSKGKIKNDFGKKVMTEKPEGITLPYDQKLFFSTRIWNTRPPPSTTTSKPKQAFKPTSSSIVSTTTTRPPDTTAKLYYSTFANRHTTFTLANSGSSKERFHCLGCRSPSIEQSTENSISSSKFTTTTKPSATLNHNSNLKTMATTTTFPASTKNTTTANNITSLIANTTPKTLTGRNRNTAVYSTTPRSKYTSRISASSRSSTIIPYTLFTSPKSVTNSSTKATPSGSRHWRTVASKTAANSNKDTRASQRNAIFDLYLNTERPKFTTIKFVTQNERVYRRLIFADGTTSPATPWKRNGAQELRIK